MQSRIDKLEADARPLHSDQHDDFAKLFELAEEKGEQPEQCLENQGGAVENPMRLLWEAQKAKLKNKQVGRIVLTSQLHLLLEPQST